MSTRCILVVIIRIAPFANSSERHLFPELCKRESARKVGLWGR